MLRFNPSIIAASALMLSIQHKQRFCPDPSKITESNFDLPMITKLGLNEQQMTWCMKELRFLHIGSSKSSLRAVRKKYTSTKYQAIIQLINNDL